MRFLKCIFDFYINASVHVALVVVAMGQIAAHTLSASVPIKFWLLLFCSTLTAYNFIKFKDSFLREKSRSFFAVSLILTTVFCGISSLFLIFLMPLSILFIYLIAGGIVLLYAVPLSKSLQNFRNRSGLKMHLVGLAWVLLTVVAPSVYAEYKHWELIVVAALLQFIYVIVAIIPFDIYDLNKDASNLGTLPLRLGVVLSKRLAILLLGLAFLGLLIFDIFSIKFTFATAVAFVILSFCIWKTNEKQSFYFTRFWIEGIPLLWWVLLML